MPKHNIPVYAIVELLMLLEQYDKSIGDYRGHTIRNSHVLVKTTGGNITISEALIMKQFSEPENVTKMDLMNALSSFRPLRLRRSA
jgi:hypothetical protein